MGEVKHTPQAAGPFFYVIDEGPRRHYATLDEARDDAQYQIDELRKDCDPEWCSSVEDIAIYECNAETDYPEEDGRCVLHSTAVPTEGPDWDESDIEYVDFILRAPAALKAEATNA